MSPLIKAACNELLLLLLLTTPTDKQQLNQSDPESERRTSAESISLYKHTLNTPTGPPGRGSVWPVVLVYVWFFLFQCHCNIHWRPDGRSAPGDDVTVMMSQ